MKNRELEDLDIIDVSEEEIRKLESLGQVSNEKLKQKKNIITKKIAYRNMKSCDENVEAFLKQDEKVQYKFKGMMTGLQYLAALGSFEYAYAPAITMMDFGMYYIAYVTNKRLFLFEVNNIYKVKRSYIFDFNEIINFKYKIKKGCVKFDFKISNNTKNVMRETYFFYTSYYKNRIIFNSIDKNVEEIAKYIEEKVKLT